MALLGAWGGPAVAGSLIGSAQVRNDSLTGRDIRNRSLTGSDLKSNSVTGRVVGKLSGRDFQMDSIDGAAIDENALASVPRARLADHAAAADNADKADRATTADALSGSRVQRILFAKPAGADVSALDLGGLKLRARCTGSGALTLTASTTAGPGFVRSAGTYGAGSTATPFYVEDDDFRATEEIDVLGPATDNASGQIGYLGADGSAVTVSFIAESSLPASRGYACLLSGTAVQAGA